MNRAYELTKDHEDWSPDGKYSKNLEENTQPAPEVQGDWGIDHSAGSPILVYQNCSVIQDDQAYYVLRLIQEDQRAAQ